MKNLLTYTVLSSLLITGLATASEKKEFHDADPRNSSWRGGIGASDSGEIKLATGGGFTNVFGDGTQTNMLLEYYTDSQNFRFRDIHFDERFGGVYLDIMHTEDFSDSYSVGYMLPLKSEDGTLWFPSVNYAYVDWNTSGIGNGLSDACNNYVDSEAKELCSSLKDSGITGKKAVETFLGDDMAQLGTVSLYAVKPWNETHYSVLQVNSGKSFDGVEMSVFNAMWLQGVRTKLGDNVLNIYVELKYDVLEIEGTNYNPVSETGDAKSEEAMATIGFDFRF
ncbi:hypothetical protein BCU83_18450 [Vibrio breoganii]|uniref:hypothetical protein n=1 Tax=Vibrio breoganii TaxID=553239 RepID=UPI000C85A522|nr:hypothetical protein [Vibrio breoganii]PMG84762.1 hypothetical protein BCU83_18450 [Vibrio breoganii]PMO33950.1 hypothetical protein BCT12_01050 [Vibrio breoganii]PMO54092.1 hypothetical protein BCT07_17365 [Vibrio breoganii]